MKKILAALLVLAMALSLAACSGSSEAKTIDLSALDKAVQEASLFSVEMQPANEKMMQSVVKLDMSLAEKYVYYICGEYTGEEYGLFQCASEEDAKTLASALETRVETLKATYADYAADALPRIENAVIKQSGVYAGIIIADDYNAAAKLFEEYFA